MKTSVKKIFAFLMTIILLASMAACQKAETPPVDGVVDEVPDDAPVVETLANSVRPEGEAISVDPVMEETRDTVEDGDIVVSPDGDDSNPGTLDKPLKTIGAAKEKMKSVEGTERKIVWLRGGYYQLDATVEFNEEDRSNVSYKAYDGEEVIISAGAPVSGWKKTSVNGITVWVADVDETFNTLYKADKELTLARFPDVGKESKLKVTSVNEADASRPGYAAFHVNPNTLAANGINDLIGARVRTYHYWAEETHTITDYNRSNGRIAMHIASSNAIFSGDPCVIEGIKSGLSVSGEWYLDKTEMKVYYVPYEGDDINSTVLYYGKLQMGFDIYKTQGLSFEGIRFSFSAYDDKLCDYSYQAAIQVPGFIEINGAENIAFRGCTFNGLGHDAILLRSNANNVEVTDCLFQDLGASAVSVVGYVYRVMQPLTEVNEPNTPKNILIKNNRIDNYGRVFNSGIGVKVLVGQDIEISHNEITNGYYSAISVGWVWGFDYSPSKNITISDNLIHEIGGLLGDLGGIYTLGSLPGSFITNNVVYNITNGVNTYGGWGIYNDEGSSEIIVEKNVVFNCTEEPYHLHYGREILLRNNILMAEYGYPVEIDPDHPDKEHYCIFVDNNLLVINTNKAEGEVQRRSKLYVTTDVPYDGYNTEFKGNIYWDEGSTPVKDLVNTLIKNNSPMYVDGIYEDPLFSEENIFDSEKEIPDFMPSEDANVYSTGFETWDYSGAGNVSEINLLY